MAGGGWHRQEVQRDPPGQTDSYEHYVQAPPRHLWGAASPPGARLGALAVLTDWDLGWGAVGTPGWGPIAAGALWFRR